MLTLLYFYMMFLFHFIIVLFASETPDLTFEFHLFDCFCKSFSILFVIDWYSLYFMAFVYFISSCVIVYSNWYMEGDWAIVRFNSTLMLFVISMMLLIFGGNLITIMIGWDGLGLVSFLLVVYYPDKVSMASGMLTIVMNRFGDGLILMSIYFWGSYSGFKMDILYNSKIGSMLLIIAFMTKSAQSPFSPWLPAAMSAPTPISSLVHSSTLVTAGVYLCIRFNYIFQDQTLCFILMVMSLKTMIVGGMLANIETDFKKIVAMSTMSQLGLMMFALSLGFTNLAFFHMIAHASFKSLLFLSAGNFISSGNQDSRESGSSLIPSPLTYITMLCPLICMMAMPFTIGFFSKDYIAENLLGSGFYIWFYITFLLGCAMTITYSVKIMVLIVPIFFNGNVTMSMHYSMYLIYSTSMLTILVILYAKAIYNFIPVSDFTFISFPMNSMWIFLLLTGIMLKFNINLSMNYYSFMRWFKWLNKIPKKFDMLFKFDQLWMESTIYKKLEDFSLGSKNFSDLDSKIIWISFMMLWFILIMCVSL